MEIEQRPLSQGVVVLAGLALAIAYYFQYFHNVPPCSLCYYQRYLYMGIMATGFAYSLKQYPALKRLLLALIVAEVTLALYHVGVEYKWIPMPASCGGGGQGKLSLDALLATPPARCDSPTFFLFGLSLGEWNAIYSLALLGFFSGGYRYVPFRT